MSDDAGPLPDGRTDPPGRGDERAQLAAFLDYQRETVVLKASGLSDADAARRLVPSLTTVAGLIRHLADVERSWFLEEFEGQEYLAYRWSEEDPDGEFRIAEGERLGDIIADYLAACALSREVVARHDLEEPSHARGGAVSLRWIMIHMIEETARHLGHIDILREQLDGVTGE
jgi:uncharacterized damage-inducible protein DinB